MYPVVCRNAVEHRCISVIQTDREMSESDTTERRVLSLIGSSCFYALQLSCYRLRHATQTSNVSVLTVTTAAAVTKLMQPAHCTCESKGVFTDFHSYPTELINR